MSLAQALALVKLDFFSMVNRAHSELQNEPGAVIIRLLDVKIYEHWWVACIGGWNCNLTTIDQWRGPLSNGTLLAGGVAPLVNGGIGGWTRTDHSASLLFYFQLSIHDSTQGIASF